MTDKAFVWVLAALIAWGLYLLRPRPDTASDARIAQLEAHVVRLQRQLDVAVIKSNDAAIKVNVARNAIKTPDFRLAVDSAMAVALDTTATIKELRLALVKTVEQAERYQAEVLRYQEAVDTMVVAHVQERQAFSETIDTLRALVQAQAPTRCTYFGVPCPNRSAAFVLGVVSALVLTLAVVL